MKGLSTKVRMELNIEMVDKYRFDQLMNIKKNDYGCVIISTIVNLKKKSDDIKNRLLKKKKK